MNNPVILRDYQDLALEGCDLYWRSGGLNPLIVLPTGSGKAICIAAMVKDLISRYPHLRIAVVTHVRELVLQDYEEMLRYWPQAPVGIVSAGLDRRDVGKQIIICSVQSVWRHSDILGSIDLLVIDEAHLIGRRAESMYGRLIAALRAKIDVMPLCGWTATPYRLDSGRLDTGDNRLFDGVAYEVPIGRLIEQGYLCRLVSTRGEESAQIETAAVGHKGRNGDFIVRQLEAAAMHGDLVMRACADIVRQGAGYNAWLLFCSGVDHAAEVCQSLGRLGISCGVVHGRMDKQARDATIGAFKCGELRALASVNILSVGFNHPGVDLIALLRPTESLGLYQQQIGRGLRIDASKSHCRILDFSGNIRKHGCIDDPTITPAKRARGEPLTRDCPICCAILPLAARESRLRPCFHRGNTQVPRADA